MTHIGKEAAFGPAGRLGLLGHLLELAGHRPQEGGKPLLQRDLLILMIVDVSHGRNIHLAFAAHTLSHAHRHQRRIEHAAPLPLQRQLRHTVHNELLRLDLGEAFHLLARLLLQEQHPVAAGDQKLCLWLESGHPNGAPGGILQDLSSVAIGQPDGVILSYITCKIESSILRIKGRDPAHQRPPTLHHQRELTYVAGKKPVGRYSQIFPVYLHRRLTVDEADRMVAYGSHPACRRLHGPAHGLPSQEIVHIYVQIGP